MDDEFLYKELQAISGNQSRIESIVTRLESNMDKMCTWKEDVLPTLQTCKNYMEARADLPEKISDQGKEIERLKEDLRTEKSANVESRKRTDFLMVWFWKISGAVLLIGIINVLLVAIGRFIDIEYVLK
jgi:predicted RNase H-like nuclease (RuvC/YqgF family)